MISSSFNTYFYKSGKFYYGSYCKNIPSSLEKPLLQYADFAVWQRSYLEGESIKAQIEYWEKQLKETSPILELPLDYSRPSVQSFRGDSYTLKISNIGYQKLQKISQKEEVTLFTTLVSLFSISLKLFRFKRICVI